MSKFHKPENIKSKKNEEVEEFPSDEDELDWASFFGLNDGASQEEIDQAYEDQM